MSLAKVKEFSFVCFVSFAVVIGCFIFCRGFLLNRQVFTEKSKPQQSPFCDTDLHAVDLGPSCVSAQPLKPRFSKAVLILLDAFRYDFIFRMPFLAKVVDTERMIERKESMSSIRPLSCIFKFIADPPTTTMQRLKALMSGTMPTFIDASANFNSYEVEEDNLIYQLNATGKRIAFLGDDTWLSLFPRSLFSSPYVEAHPSFDAWDLDTVDRAVNASLSRIFEPENSWKWDILIAHLLGVDHCGHRYGPNHPEMARKLTESDNILEFIYNSMTEDTLLVVFGDHGMTMSGDHGGDSVNEVEAGIVFISKQKELTDLNFQPPFQCHSFLHQPIAVSQIDFVPTISHYLGLPIPLSSLGQLFPKFLPASDYSPALMQNVMQVSRYVTDFAKISNPELIGAYNDVRTAFKEFLLSTNTTSQTRFNLQAEQYLGRVKTLALLTWTKFDLVSISCGLAIVSLAIISLVYTVRTHFHQELDGVLLILPVFWVGSGLLNFFTESTFGITMITVVTALGLILLLGASATISLTSQNVVTKIVSKTTKCDTMSLLLYAFTCATVFSNSFVINEGTLLGAVFLATAFLHVLLQSFEWSDLQLNSFTKKSRGFLLNKKFFIWRNGIRSSWISLMSLALLVRAAGMFFRCREELTECKEEFMLHKTSASLPEGWVAYKCVRFGVALLSVATFVVTFREWMLVQECISSSRRPAALIGKYIPTILIVLIGAHWALEGLPFSIPHLVVIRPALGYFPMVYQTMTVLAICTVWCQTLCSSGCSNTHRSFELGRDKARRKLKIEHLGTVGHNGDLTDQSHKSDAVLTKADNDDWLYLLASGCHQDLFTCSLLINCVLVILLLVQVTSTGIVPAIIIIPYVIIAIVNLNVDGTTGQQGSWSIAVLWTLASQYFFYCTGHHAVFSAIPWDSAFIVSSDGLGSSGPNSWVGWVRPGLAVLGNLEVSQIIFSLALPLLVYWRVPTVPGILLGTRERSVVYSLGGKFIVLHAAKLLACMLCATLHRRHLMVWKIFAPRLIFEIVSFLVTWIFTILSLLYVTRVDYHYQRMLVKGGI